MAAVAAILEFRSEHFWRFLSTCRPDTSNQFSSQFAFWFRTGFQIDFQNGGHSGYFRIKTSLDCLGLQVALILATKFRVNSSFGLGEE